MRISGLFKPLLWGVLAVTVLAIWFEPIILVTPKEPDSQADSPSRRPESLTAQDNGFPATLPKLNPGLSDSTQQTRSPLVSGDSSERALATLLEDLLLAKLPPEEINDFLRLLSKDVLVTFFEQNSSIDERWLIDNGLSTAQVRGIYQTLAMPPNRVDLGKAGLSEGVSYRALHDGLQPHYSNAIFNLDKSVFIHTKLPDDITSGSVIARWVNLDAPDFSHFNAYPLQGTSQETQEFWLRQADGWQPGSYRLEIYTPDGAANRSGPVSYFEFEVYEYGAK